MILTSFLASLWMADLMAETIGQRLVPRWGFLKGYRFVELWRMKERKIDTLFERYPFCSSSVRAEENLVSTLVIGLRFSFL